MIIFVLILLFCHFAEKTTVVRFPEDPPIQVLHGTSINSKGLIRPDLRLYEKRSSTASSIDDTKGSSASSRRESGNELHLPGHNQVAPIPPSPFLNQLDARSLKSYCEDNNRGSRKGSFLNIGQDDSFDIVSSDFNPDEIPSRKTSALFIERLSTPLRPLDPAYHAIEPLRMSRVPHALSSYLRDDELALPPGYVTTFRETDQKY